MCARTKVCVNHIYVMYLILDFNPSVERLYIKSELAKQRNYSNFSTTLQLLNGSLETSVIDY